MQKRPDNIIQYQGFESIIGGFLGGEGGKQAGNSGGGIGDMFSMNIFRILIVRKMLLGFPSP